MRMICSSLSQCILIDIWRQVVRKTGQRLAQQLRLAKQLTETANWIDVKVELQKISQSIFSLPVCVGSLSRAWSLLCICYPRRCPVAPHKHPYWLCGNCNQSGLHTLTHTNPLSYSGVKGSWEMKNAPPFHLWESHSIAVAMVFVLNLAVFVCKSVRLSVCRS